MAHYKDYKLNKKPKEIANKEIKSIEKGYEKISESFKRLDNDFPDFFDNNELKERYENLIEDSKDTIKEINKLIDDAKGDIR